MLHEKNTKFYNFEHPNRWYRLKKIYTMKYLSSLILFITLVSVSCAQNTSTSEEAKTKASVKTLSQADFKKTFENKENLQLLDVRTPQEIAQGKISGADELDIYDPQFTSKISTLNYDKSQPVIVYCKAGGRSAQAAQILIDHGFEKVYNLEGGYSNYK